MDIHKKIFPLFYVVKEVHIHTLSKAKASFLYITCTFSVNSMIYPQKQCGQICSSGTPIIYATILKFRQSKKIINAKILLHLCLFLLLYFVTIK